jgi:hypothetical protein
MSWVAGRWLPRRWTTSCAALASGTVHPPASLALAITLCVWLAWIAFTFAGTRAHAWAECVWLACRSDRGDSEAHIPTAVARYEASFAAEHPVHVFRRALPRAPFLHFGRHKDHTSTSDCTQSARILPCKQGEMQLTCRSYTLWRSGVPELLQQLASAGVRLAVVKAPMHKPAL